MEAINSFIYSGTGTLVLLLVMVNLVQFMVIRHYKNRVDHLEGRNRPAPRRTSRNRPYGSAPRGGYYSHARGGHYTPRKKSLWDRIW